MQKKNTNNHKRVNEAVFLYASNINYFANKEVNNTFVFYHTLEQVICISVHGCGVIALATRRMLRKIPHLPRRGAVLNNAIIKELWQLNDTLCIIMYLSYEPYKHNTLSEMWLHFNTTQFQQPQMKAEDFKMLTSMYIDLTPRKIIQQTSERIKNRIIDWKKQRSPKAIQLSRINV